VNIRDAFYEVLRAHGITAIFGNPGFERAAVAYAGALGWGLPAAIGLQLGDPSRRVVAILGDGALHYTVSVLWTAARYRVPVVFVVARRPAPDRSAPAAPARHLSATAVGSFGSLSGQTAGLCAATTGEGERWR